MFTIRPATPADEPFLWEMLYEAIYVAPDAPRPDRSILQEPSLAHYVAGWGQQPGDFALLAIEQPGGHPVGAAWLRCFSADDPGWGFVDAATPEVSMALLPAYRGQGIGTALLVELIAQATGRYVALSLSVDPQNPAMRLYERLGFVVVGASGTSLTMRKALAAPGVSFARSVETT
jgi:ribosomal protein S18 acetylase RimI-like enzyme